jgi:rhodanese-related sulfurtransferase
VTLDPSIVDQAVGALINAVQVGGGVVKQGFQVAGTGLGYAKQAYDQVAPVVKDAADTAAPYVKAAASTARTVAGPVLQAVEPTVKAGADQVGQFLSGQGLSADTLTSKASGVTSVAGSAFSTAKPAVSTTVSTLSQLAPNTLAQYALIALGTYYLGPPVLKGFFGSFRGYAGEISPAAALDSVTNNSNTVLIDIRTEREKETGGVPDLPSNNRLLEVEYAQIEDRKIRSQLRDASGIERQVTALQIASLKKVGKGTTVMLLDKNGSTSRAIAKELNRRGFRKVFVVQNGFSGWTSSKLQTKYSSTVATPEILAPVVGTVRSALGGGNRTQRQKALPSGR